jgi:hypothetical protein
MSVLGVRCSNSDYTFAVLEGTKDKPILVSRKNVAYPKDFDTNQSFKWLYQEAAKAISDRNVSLVLIKRDESPTHGNAKEDRIGYEAIVMLAAADKGIEAHKKVNATISKDLGLRETARDLARQDTSAIPGFESMPKKAQEAIQSSWSGLA